MSDPTYSMEENRAFYNRLSASYDALADHDEHVARDEAVKFLDAQPGEKILEIGYGTGHALADLAKLVGDSGKVIGIDISDGMRDVAQARLEKEGVANRVELLVDDARKLSFEDDSFDAVIMTFTLELFEEADIAGVLAECRRILKPNGRLAVAGMNITPDGKHESMLTHLYKWLHRHFPHYIDCRPIDAVKFVEDAGFNITQKHEMEIWTLPVVSLVASNS
ncbi:class I SAM-dependent methyltransferase [Calycomorphotria hydatis]|uniref:Demethylmenaquinone methyltransferase n=1 Tax=Calycomorphotria hydatis TaxID=2528027 RepID=A0A517TD58_9PLAN|nr:class I SAM-dependent methyltransferase [Calycomorphotria hydatis]QDT66298.1 Demethylmenaquinone methyltransferase [Calycomorphotria hydatis]